MPELVLFFTLISSFGLGFSGNSPGISLASAWETNQLMVEIRSDFLLVEKLDGGDGFSLTHQAIAMGRVGNLWLGGGFVNTSLSVDRYEEEGFWYQAAIGQRKWRISHQLKGGSKDSSRTTLMARSGGDYRGEVALSYTQFTQNGLDREGWSVRASFGISLTRSRSD